MQWAVLAMIVLAAAIVRADAPSGYQCTPGTAKRGVGCTCPQGYSSKRDDDNVATCAKQVTECERATPAIVRAYTTDLAHSEVGGFRSAFGPAARARCERDRWAPEHRRCFIGASREEAAFGCLEKLPAAQRGGLDVEAARAHPLGVKLGKTELELRGAIVFQPGTATVVSGALVAEVAKVLRANPSVFVEVQAHGGAPKLTQQQAEAVRTLLVQAGVGGERLVARGYGDAQPIASSTTAWGRARNRRVQFVLLAKAPSSNDRDGDGVVDVSDRCVDQPETVNGVDDGDGCPDAMLVGKADGCSDGTREALRDVALFPDVAACGARWQMSSLAAARTSQRTCGGDVECTSPADACQTGWHVCGINGPKELVDNLSGKQCAGMTDGGFVAAQPNSSCDKCGVGAGYGAACCGKNCVQQLGSCVWPGSTAWFGVVDQHIQACGEIEMRWRTDQHGVLCCRD